MRAAIPNNSWKALWTPQTPSFWAVLFVMFVTTTSLAESLGSNASSWGTLTEENNNLGSDQDRYYVNGFNASLLSPVDAQGRSWTERIDRSIFDNWTWLFSHTGTLDRRCEWTVLGQQIFTPANKTLTVPDPDDRPYAAWLYTGLDLLQDRDTKRLDDLYLTIGVVGPYALGRQVQNGVHGAFGFGSANGWNHQLRNEPGLTLGYARKWRIGTTLQNADELQIDAIPELGATVGNVKTQAEASILARVGWGLDASYGPRLLSPGLEGDGYFASERSVRRSAVCLFAGVQERAVAHDIFLDGNSFQNGPSVSKYPFTHSWILGASAFAWKQVRLDMAVVHEGEEFKGQFGSESYGSITFSVRL